MRFLTRSPRFPPGVPDGIHLRLAGLASGGAGPAGGGSRSFLGSNYLTVVSVYSMLLLSEACFWNFFGFDRSAAQFYFLAPVSFTRVMIAKNLERAVLHRRWKSSQ